MQMLVVDKLRETGQGIDLLDDFKVETFGVARQEIHSGKAMFPDNLGKPLARDLMGLDPALDIRDAMT